MTPIPLDKVNTTPISELRTKYKTLSEAYYKFVEGKMIICPMCGEAKNDAGYYSNKANKTGKFCYCKECCRNMATDYNKQLDVYMDNPEKAKDVLRMMNRPYIDTLYKKCVAGVSADITERSKSCGWVAYVTQISSLPEWKDLAWKDSSFGLDDPDNEEDENSRRITNVMIKRWGVGFSDSDYLTMDDHYKMLKNNNPNADSNQEIFIEDLCRTRLLMLKAMRGEGKSDDFTKYSKSYQETFRQAGLKTVAEADASNDETLGMTLLEISKYVPETYYSNKTLYKDFDGTEEYLKRFVLRPLKNLIAGSSERDGEYSVKTEE